MTPEFAYPARSAVAAVQPNARSPGSREPAPAHGPGGHVPHPANPDEVQKRAIARAVWTDLAWLMPQGRTVTVTFRDGKVAVELGPPADA